MQRMLVVSVSCGETTCGGCQWRGSHDSMGHFHCVLFGKWDGLRSPRAEYTRCRACLAAEHKAKEGKR